MRRWRHYTLVVALVAGFACLAVRIGYLHVTERDFLKEQGDLRSIRVESVPAHRGVIFDRNGEALAVSTPVSSAWLDPSRVTPSRTDLARLGETLGLAPGTLAARLRAQAGSEFMYLGRQLTPELAARVEALAIDGVHFSREYRRYYPAGEVAAHVVGLTNIDDEGQEGAELAFDQWLDGVPGRQRVLRNRRGQTVKYLSFERAPELGKDLTLSLDLRLQFLAYRELKSAVESHRARSASLVMLDVRTGEVLAMANQPAFNPNSDQFDYAAMRNRAITDRYEPGSTIKPFTMMAALESGRYHRQTRIDTSPGYFRVGRKLVEDPVNRGVLTLDQILMKSSQVGVAKVALDLAPDAVYGVLARAGFGRYVGIGLPGEVSGVLSAAGLDSDIGRVTLAYGYGLTATPLQLARAYLTLVTGRRMPVTVLKTATAPEGEDVFDPALTQQVLAMMELVTHDEGTAPKAQVPGYRVAGKTGTVRKVGKGGYDDERHVALFAGVAPVSDPRIVVVVVVNEPRDGAFGGGAVAAPVFSRVVARAMRVLNVPPDARQREAA